MYVSVSELEKRAFRFSHMGTAQSFSERSSRTKSVLQNRDGSFLVTTLMDAIKLSNAGYKLL